MLDTMPCFTVRQTIPLLGAGAEPDPGPGGTGGGHRLAGHRPRCRPSRQGKYTRVYTVVCLSELKRNPSELITTLRVLLGTNYYYLLPILRKP